jgi:hypothetical protein
VFAVVVSMSSWPAARDDAAYPGEHP